MSANTLRQYREQRTARKLLLKMAMREDLVARIESLANETGARAAYWREKFRGQYRRMIGVDVERREELRRTLDAIVAGAALELGDVLSGINGMPQEKGSDPRESWPSA